MMPFFSFHSYSSSVNLFATQKYVFYQFCKFNILKLQDF